MHRRWLLAFAILSGCHKLFSLTEVPDVPDAPPTPVEDCARDVSAGRDFTCAIDRPGTVWCWGLNDTGQVSPGGPRHVLAPSPISLPAPATQVAAGRKFACARLEDGTAWCWGHNGAGQLGSGTSGDVGPLEVPLEAIDEIRTGGHHACARLQSDGTIWCWGENRNFATAQPTTGGTTPPVAVAGTEGSKRLILAHRHGCAIGPDDRLRCWGRNDRNQLGVTGPSSPELRTPELGPVVDAATSGKSGCAIDANGLVQCWGENGDGQLPNGSYESTTMPVATPLTKASQIAMGGFGGCARLDDGTVQCWGHSFGPGVPEAGAGLRMTSLQGVTAISGHYYHHCALANGELVCWGQEDAHGALGRGTRSIRPTPVAISGLVPTQLAAGNLHACGLAAGAVWCWGSNVYGEVGDGTMVQRATPVPVDTELGTVTGIAAGYKKSCAWNGSEARCWGSSYFGELGNGTPAHHLLVPTPVAATNVQQIALGGRHACMLQTSGVTCFGDNNAGQLGDNTTTSSVAGVTVAGLPVTPTKVIAGGAHTCAIVPGQQPTLYCWGQNDVGQLGDDGTTARGVPIAVGIPGNVIDAGAGRDFTCALDHLGTVYCWGRNSNGQLGANTPNLQRTPVAVALPANDPAKALAVGELGACAQLATGRVYCWGAGDFGDNGNGGTDDARTPVPVSQVTMLQPGTPVLARGGFGGCAVADGTLYCWGDNRFVPDGDLSASMALPVQGLDLCRR